ncbi:Vitamin K-dependent gamma-carboxylase [Reichenbachiella agariperforans]|uniref:Vitamin K-dependent gamma-carboxylase n=1 Tax=Reichenbachiella agariperforans TaxID=156994 RepID=A0A1M6VNI1_REIAG|nr:HTTM domain-containing protein [Reichenbachiella agariperforans]SHK83127.1 Vitamin K-dependent gamma-carboxylase [Reichenbachiella agariperforans]
MKRFCKYLERISIMDLRSLAVFRMLLGVFVLLDLWVRFEDLEMFYTDDGVLQSADVLKMYGSIHAWYGTADWQYFLFGLTALFSLMIALGFFTKWATVATYVLIVSLQLRNPAVNNAGDLLLACVLCLSIFLPIAKVWSMDARRKPTDLESQFGFSSPWTFLFLLQLILMYSMAGMSKNNGTWNFDGLGIFYSMNLHTYAKKSALFLLGYSWLMWLLNYATLFLERFLWWGLLIPKYRGIMRAVLVISYVLFHFGLFWFMELGMFPWLGMILWVAVIPSGFWEWFTRRDRSSKIWDKYNIEFQSHWRGRWSFIAASLFLFVMIYSGMRSKKVIPYQTHLSRFVRQSRLNQSWNLFGGPKKSDGWLVIEAQLSDGTWVDFLQGGDSVTWKKPAVCSAMYPNHRQRKFYKNLRTGRGVSRTKYLDWAMQSWNENHRENPVKDAAIYYMSEEILPGGNFTPVQKKRLAYRKVKSVD